LALLVGGLQEVGGSPGPLISISHQVAHAGRNWIRLADTCPKPDRRAQEHHPGQACSFAGLSGRLSASLSKLSTVKKAGSPGIFAGVSQSPFEGVTGPVAELFSH
jgi:hypothetical protein